ncbi:AMP-binding protein [filamentous cyanobacterium LEGE 11480]|uniref:AMP-binding protein n=1 Tax=Romeriopsis navalis LEGE 11480 TaxID=2777977 RepID=A0A928VMZ8_9CYAN|nr:AMP-binding protein [Romeriopsis navalis]MBE9030668.1 AMP-binding protein [Romeriopsis navalis LEGE 11480]
MDMHSIESCTDQYVGFQRSEIEQSISARFDRIAQRFGQRIALTSQGNCITYNTVNQIANRLARSLQQRATTDQTPVVVLLNHDAPLLIAILGILKAGKAYVVLEPSLPTGRFNRILADLQPRLIITNHQHWDLAVNVSSRDCQIINLEALNETIDSRNLNLAIAPEALAAVFYTSGSTGQPKGVKRSHQGVLHRVWLETNDYQIQAGDKIALLYSCGFGTSVSDIFNALLNGATLCLYDFKTGGIANLTTWLQQEAISMFHLPVAVFQQWLDTMANSSPKQFPHLRQVNPSGRLYRRDVERFWKYFAAPCVLVQRFSSTETTMATRLLISPQTELPDPIVPVGYPVLDKEILLLDEHRQPVTHNGPGEIAVRSRYLSPGYWRDLALTRQKFLPDPEDAQSQIYCTGDLGQWRSDGCLQYLGRKDFMLKIRGYRVEPSEIETALFECDIVQQAVVIADTENAQDPRLIAYVVPTVPQPQLSNQLYHDLQDKLPDYMMPAAFVPMEALPLTPNGKIDRRALPAVNWSQRDRAVDCVAPRTPMETQLSQIWCTLLKLEEVSINDNFFMLGGHSLLATQMISMIRQEFQVELPLSKIFAAPTIAALTIEITLLIGVQDASQIKHTDYEQMMTLLDSLEELADDEVSQQLK